jgi:3',5'-cyclic AMP phosphodiesterase CpdA
VFAVEPDAVQVTWRRDSEGRPGVRLFTGLEPSTRHRLHVDELGVDVEATTSAPPPGEELFRFATISDTHIGCTYFGFLGRMHEPPAPEPHAVRCLRAAVRGALAWGARLIVVKGDITHRSGLEEWTAVGQELSGLPVPVAVVPGNHDVHDRRTVDPQPGLAGHGLHLVHGVEVMDVPGARLVLADTAIPSANRGRIAGLQAEITRRCARAAGAVVIALHHHIEHHALPTYLPRGIPAAEGGAFLAAVAAANPRAFVTTGHSHRYRLHRRDPVPWSEVGSTKDFPGGWAGYVVHEGGIRQVVRRVSDPTVLPWLEHTRRAALGAWQHWSPGRLDDRCFTVPFPFVR